MTLVPSHLKALLYYYVLLNVSFKYVVISDNLCSPVFCLFVSYAFVIAAVIFLCAIFFFFFFYWIKMEALSNSQCMRSTFNGVRKVITLHLPTKTTTSQQCRILICEKCIEGSTKWPEQHEVCRTQHEERIDIVWIVNIVNKFMPIPVIVVIDEVLEICETSFRNLACKTKKAQFS